MMMLSNMVTFPLPGLVEITSMSNGIPFSSIDASSEVIHV